MAVLGWISSGNGNFKINKNSTDFVRRTYILLKVYIFLYNYFLSLFIHRIVIIYAYIFYIIIMISRRRVAPVIGRGLGTVCCWTTAARGSNSSTWSGQASEDRRRLRCRAVQRPRPFCPPADVSPAGFRRYSPQSSARVSAC